MSFDASQISQGTLPFLGSLFGEIISSKKSAFRRNLIQALVEEDELLAAKNAAVLLYYQYYQHVCHGTCQGVAGQRFGPSHTQP